MTIFVLYILRFLSCKHIKFELPHRLLFEVIGVNHVNYSIVIASTKLMIRDIYCNSKATTV